MALYYWKVRAILAILGGFNSPLIDPETEEIEEKIQIDGADSTHFYFLDSELCYYLQNHH